MYVLKILTLYYLIFNTNNINVVIDIFNIYCCIVIIFAQTLSIKLKCGIEAVKFVELPRAIKCDCFFGVESNAV